MPLATIADNTLFEEDIPDGTTDMESYAMPRSPVHAEPSMTDGLEDWDERRTNGARAVMLLVSGVVDNIDGVLGSVGPVNEMMSEYIYPVHDEVSPKEPDTD